jgi:uncharacterized protein (TIGR00299 family) protein
VTAGRRLGWLDCGSGVSGDMLLGAVVDAGVPLELLQRTLAGLRVEPVELTAEPVRRGGVAATRVRVHVPAAAPRRGPAEVAGVLAAAELDPEVRRVSLRVFELLAAAEATAHGTPVGEVHFHEVGALDALADVVGGVAGAAALGVTTWYAGPVATGSGTVSAEHGPMPVPTPAVLALLTAAGAPVRLGGPSAELATPTGAALLAGLVDAWTEPPPMTPRHSGRGAGERQVADRPNVVSIVVGEPAPAVGGPSGSDAGEAVVIAANVDDLDPRVWPGVLARLLAAGAADAWLTPILMKKGRPAHTVQALAAPAAADAVRAVLHRETTTIGTRSWPVAKHALQRRAVTVTVHGHPVRVKVASLAGSAVTATPEFDDVAELAARLGIPVRAALAAAVSAVEAAGLAPAADR